jgi:hypothetical protein
MCVLHTVAVADVIDFGAIGTVVGDWRCPGLFPSHILDMPGQKFWRSIQRDIDRLLHPKSSDNIENSDVPMDRVSGCDCEPNPCGTP